MGGPGLRPRGRAGGVSVLPEPPFPQADNGQPDVCFDGIYFASGAPNEANLCRQRRHTGLHAANGDGLRSVRPGGSLQPEAGDKIQATLLTDGAQQWVLQDIKVTNTH